MSAETLGNSSWVGDGDLLGDEADDTSASRRANGITDSLGCIHVAIRVRPLSHKEKTLGTQSCCEALGESSIVSIRKAAVMNSFLSSQAAKVNEFAFDTVFSERATQKEVYERTTVDLLPKLLDGYNVTIFAYGTTSAGKTHTMFGPLTGSLPSEVFDDNNVEELSSIVRGDFSLGIIPRAIRDLLSQIELKRKEATTSGERWDVRMTYVEVYNEQIFDLLNVTDERMLLQLREDQSRGVVVIAGVTERKIDSITDAFELIAHGNKRRMTDSTCANQASSRSHAVLQIILRHSAASTGAKSEASTSASSQPNASRSTATASSSSSHRSSSASAKASGTKNKSDNKSSRSGCSIELITMEAKLSLVDLAGSERAHVVDVSSSSSSLLPSSLSGRRSKRALEGSNINKSLLALANCINALAANSTAAGKSKKKVNVKYRDSKLTLLLKNSLEGKSHLVMIANINPSHYMFEDSLNTLKYANRAKNIKIAPIAMLTVSTLNAVSKDQEAVWMKREEQWNVEKQRLLEENEKLHARIAELEEIVASVRESNILFGVPSYTTHDSDRDNKLQSANTNHSGRSTSSSSHLSEDANYHEQDDSMKQLHADSPASILQSMSGSIGSKDGTDINIDINIETQKSATAATGIDTTDTGSVDGAATVRPFAHSRLEPPVFECAVDNLANTTAASSSSSFYLQGQQQPSLSSPSPLTGRRGKLKINQSVSSIRRSIIASIRSVTIPLMQELSASSFRFKSQSPSRNINDDNDAEDHCASSGNNTRIVNEVLVGGDILSTVKRAVEFEDNEFPLTVITSSDTIEGREEDDDEDGEDNANDDIICEQRRSEHMASGNNHHHHTEFKANSVGDDDRDDDDNDHGDEPVQQDISSVMRGNGELVARKMSSAALPEAFTSTANPPTSTVIPSTSTPPYFSSSPCISSFSSSPCEKSLAEEERRLSLTWLADPSQYEDVLHAVNIDWEGGSNSNASSRRASGNFVAMSSSSPIITDTVHISSIIARANDSISRVIANGLDHRHGGSDLDKGYAENKNTLAASAVNARSATQGTLTDSGSADIDIDISATAAATAAVASERPPMLYKTSSESSLKSLPQKGIMSSLMHISSGIFQQRRGAVAINGTVASPAAMTATLSTVNHTSSESKLLSVLAAKNSNANNAPVHSDVGSVGSTVAALREAFLTRSKSMRQPPSPPIQPIPLLTSATSQTGADPLVRPSSIRSGALHLFSGLTATTSTSSSSSSSAIQPAAVDLSTPSIEPLPDKRYSGRHWRFKRSQWRFE